MSTAAEGEVVDLAALIHPLTIEEFFADYWEKKPLHQRRGDATYYESVLTDRDLDAIISSSDLRYPAIQLAKGGGYYPPEAYTRSVKLASEVFEGVVDVEKVRSEYRAGATVVLPALNRTWPALRSLCASLEAHFNHGVSANGYLTAGDTAGFGPHYDTHEVLVLQIGGKKHWRICEPPITLPHRSQPFPRSGYTPPAPVLEVDLEPGDLLYLPRGYVHSASTGPCHSAHVTIGITVYTWVELVSELLVSCKNIPGFREALPAGFAGRGDLRAALKEGLLQRIDELRRHTDFDDVVDSFTQRVRSTWPRPTPAFQASARVVGPTTVLRAPAPGRYVIATEKGNTSLEFDGKKLLLPAGVRATLDAMCARAAFRVADLPRTLDDHAALAFARYLEGEGFLRHVD